MRVIALLVLLLSSFCVFAQNQRSAAVDDTILMDVCNDKHPAPCATPPKPISTPEPVYPEKARKARLQGTVILEVVIGNDGLAHDIVVQRGLGMGFDEQAIEAVKRWTFEPGTYQGNAVSVKIRVNVNFHLK